MSVAAAFEARPGPVTGRYPERKWEPMPALDRFAQDAAGKLRQFIGARAGPYRKRARAILRRAPALEAIDDAALRAEAARLSADLHRHGFRRDLVEAGFALVREVSGRTLGKRHFAVQLMGGLAMLDGRIAEMATGEGKSLTATLAAGVAALAGVPVHVITVNDYLVARDAAEMAPLYGFLGLTVAHVLPEMSEAEKRAAYGASITYCSNKQVVFDYLRDRLAREDGAPPAGMMLRGLCFGIVDEADSVLIDEARTPLVIAEKSRGNEARETTFREALEFARALMAGRDYTHREEERSVELTEAGRRRLEGFGQAAGGIWRGRLRREELVGKALTALCVFHRDHHYIVQDEKVHIVDEFTGRLMPDRSWEQGLHQMIETKEGVALTDGQVTRAKISYQAFFRRYMHLGGMTGTAGDVRGELWATYRLGVVPIPTNRRSRRKTARDCVHRTEAEKWRAVVARARTASEAGRAVLIGTRSVAASEAVSAALTEAGLVHSVLSARQDAEEADVIAQAGRTGRITVATNMAGRGTDIHLDDAVRRAGGLHVIMTERHESRRIDRQLAGRSGRQGDPGRVEVHLSLEDELLRRFLPDAARGIRGPLARRLAGPGLLRSAQKRAEQADARARRAVLRTDEKLADFLAFAGRGS
ncbi:hypothetical protein [Jannaschia seohaensis]|uniref:Protein translocase subunit SecA n=1 Tax=Jannaschia seohaensis TaxID=475081 RepID=A0A2Y9APA2_9RHOB|nr:hypothetical protein [Jannaschia seohaensis]PWJ20243.1 preprotein translocase subunit SecA [Jannaschia seohaensis]SSA44247.1 preprotein translocase subunit SecA [Jannaschia seohaensis]